MLEKWMKTFPSPTRGIYIQINSWNGCLDDTRMPPKLHEISHLTSWNCWVERGFLVKDSQYKSSSKHEIHCKKKLKLFSTKIKNLSFKKKLWWLSIFQLAIEAHILLPLPCRDLNVYPHSFTACLKFQACHPADQSFLIRTYSRWPQLFRSAQGNPSTQGNLNLKGPPYP